MYFTLSLNFKKDVFTMELIRFSNKISLLSFNQRFYKLLQAVQIGRSNVIPTGTTNINLRFFFSLKCSKFEAIQLFTSVRQLNSGFRGGRFQM